ncbi:hypothetical protein L1049_020580 [Liquidambar formosana]|uniref:Senescence regulator n=1 Tax=Liquidambar formosana TaxID=63359 RepID=A0AAP0SDB4_LIQFO
MEGLKASPPSSAIRFLGLLKQPDSNPDPLEWTESDVVWSSDPSDSINLTFTDPISPSFSTTSNSPTNHRQDNHFRPSKFGLSAALSDDIPPPLLRRKPSLNPSLSAASAAKTIPPVPLPRSVSSSEELTGSGSGKFLQSAPVNVPIWPKWKEGPGQNLKNFYDEDDVDVEHTEEEMLPPHEIVARSQARMTTFSVFEGVGRTLKGRDLRRVRNAVFQKTGFLD